jgi:hypothetical protein
MSHTQTRPTAATRPNHYLTAARCVAGLAGALGLAGIAYLVQVAPEEAVWTSPWVDVPLVAWKAVVSAGFLMVALAPGIPAGSRVRIGTWLAAAEVLFSTVKIFGYDEPEGVTFVVVDLVILALLGLARRRDAGAGR